MLAWLSIAVAIFKPLDFDVQPPLNAVAWGEQLYAAHEQIDRTLKGSREVLGRWFDGRVHQEADTVTWLNPDALAGWYGWLAARDSWTKTDLLTHWQAAREKLKGRIFFIVRLNAFPKEDPLEMGTGEDANTKVLTDVKFRLSYKQTHSIRYWLPKIEQDGDFAFQPDASFAATSAGTQEASVEKRESHDILQQPFYHLSSMAPLFLASGETDEPDDGIPLGDYYGAVYLVSFKRPATMSMCRAMKLEVIRPHKVVTVNFSLLESLPEPKKADPWSGFHNQTVSPGIH